MYYTLRVYSLNFLMQGPKTYKEDVKVCITNLNQPHAL